MKFSLRRLGVAGQWLSMVVVLFLFMSGSGCVSSEFPKVQDDVTLLKAQVWTLQKQVAQLNLQVAEQENELTLIAEKEKSGDPVEPVKTAALSPAAMAEVDATMKAWFDEAVLAFDRGEYETAVQQFSSIVRERPEHRLAPEAQYRTGVAYTNLERNRRALEEFQVAVRRYPRSGRDAENRLRIGELQHTMGRVDVARQTWRELIERHPESREAIEAQKRLDQTEQDIGNR